MTKSPSPPSPRQLWLLALVLFAPLALTIWLTLATSAKTGALVTVGAVLAVFIVIFCCILWRYSVEVTPERLTVRHSLYTFSLARSDVTAVSVQELASPAQLGLVLRTNGIAGFGYLSGWFRRVGNHKAFCAVSQGPLWLLTFDGNASCRQLALSASPEVIRSIQQWFRIQ